MDAEKIILPGFIMAGLYKSHLVDISSRPVGETPAPEKPHAGEQADVAASDPIVFLGNNARSMTIVVNNPGDTFLNDNDLGFLTNILKACQLTLADVAVVNAAKGNLHINSITQQLKPNILLLFNVAPANISLPFSIPDFTAYPYNGCTVMPAPALNLINQAHAEGKLLKTKLWQTLKQLFGL